VLLIRTALRRQFGLSTANTAAEPFPPERYNETLELPDGRTIAWAEAGSSNGFPLFLFHGFPGSRLEARGVEDIGRRHNIRFICPDRPGYGRSTFQSNRRITDWPADVQHLARHIDLKRYAVLGGSGGGPYALACAHAITPDTLTAVSLLCTAAPWEPDTIRYVSYSRRLLRLLSKYMPSLTTHVIDGLIGLGKLFAASSAGKKYIDGIAVKAAATAGKEIPESETSPEAEAARRERLLSVLFEPFAQGSRGLVQEAYLLSHPYGFRLEDVPFENKVQIWHGTKDTNSPIEMVRYLKDRLPHCEMHEFGGETHFTVIKHLEEIVTELVGQQ
jgi:pimeloyl-ACP methyl ester carboxylesterase